MRCEQRVLQLKLKAHPSLFTESVGPQSCSAAFGCSLTVSTRGRKIRRRQYIRFCIEKLNAGLHPDRKRIGKITAEIGEEASREEFIPF